MQGVFFAVRLASRGLARQPWPAGAAILCLALALAVQIVVASIVNSVLWRPLPVPEPHRLATIYGFSGTLGHLTNLPYPQLQRLRELDVVEDVSAFTRFSLNLESDQPTERINVEMVADNYFPLLRPALALGRVPDAPGEVLLGHDLWRSRYGADPAVLGRTLRLSGSSFVVAGVMGPAFRGTLLDYMGNPKLWLTLQSQNRLPFIAGRDLRGDWIMNWFVGVARLKEGVSPEQAAQAVAAFEAANPPPPDATQRAARLYDAGKANFHPAARENVRRVLTLCMGIAALLLALASCSASFFLLAGTLARKPQIAMERAMGAGLGSITARPLWEAAVVTGVAIAAGAFLAHWAIQVLAAYPPPLASLVIQPVWDWRVWLTTAGAACLAVPAIAVVPVIAAARTGLTEVRSQRSGPSRRDRQFRQILVGAQVAVAASILVAAGFVLRTVTNAHSAGVGFGAENLVMAEVELFGLGVGAESRRDTVENVLLRLHQQPQTRHAAAASLMPLSVFRRPGRVQVRDGSNIGAFSNAVSANYFEVLNLPLLEGRPFAQGEAGAQEAVINQTLAALLGQQHGAVGRTLMTLDERGNPAGRYLITGIARNVRYHSLWEDDIPYFYTSIAAGAPGTPAFIVRSSGPPTPVWRALRDAVNQVQPGAFVSEPKTGAGQLNALMLEQRFLSAFFGTLGFVALLVALSGLTANLQTMILERTREFGIRMALGALPQAIVAQVLARGLVVTFAGLGFGLLAGAQVQVWLRPLAPGTTQADVWPSAVTALVLLVGSAAALLVPALRAARTDPWKAIRQTG